MGQGGEAYEHIEQWNVPLLPKDARRPPAQLEPQPWDPFPIVMMTPAQIQAEQARRQAEEEAQAQAEPDPTAHFSSTAGGGSVSSSSAGPGFYSAPPRKAPPQASPPKKARPKEPNVPPDWIIQKPPDGYVYSESKNPDYRGTPFTTSLWMNEKSQFLLSILQGPAAASPNVSGWAQYLRRTATYGCMIFGVCVTRGSSRMKTQPRSLRLTGFDCIATLSEPKLLHALGVTCQRQASL
eukprot:s42_g11.t1